MGRRLWTSLDLVQALHCGLDRCSPWDSLIIMGKKRTQGEPVKLGHRLFLRRGGEFGRAEEEERPTTYIVPCAGRMRSCKKAKVESESETQSGTKQIVALEAGVLVVHEGSEIALLRPSRLCTSRGKARE